MKSTIEVVENEKSKVADLKQILDQALARHHICLQKLNNRTAFAVETRESIAR